MAFVDSDDWISPFYLEYLVKVIVDSKCDIVECDIIRTQGIDFEEQIDEKNVGNINIFRTEEALKELIEDGAFTPICLEQTIQTNSYTENYV